MSTRGFKSHGGSICELLPTSMTAETLYLFAISNSGGSQSLSETLQSYKSFKFLTPPVFENF